MLLLTWILPFNPKSYVNGFAIEELQTFSNP